MISTFVIGLIWLHTYIIGIVYYGHYYYDAFRRDSGEFVLVGFSRSFDIQAIFYVVFSLKILTKHDNNKTSYRQIDNWK